ncbi:MAG: rRNA maturation RNase YbeY [Bacteroidales bacterium]|nr:rRNA maturation RNase YbeY [Bacteroidales bacterium]
MSYSFNFEDVKIDFPPEKNLSDWIDYAINNEGCFTGNVTYIFCSDDYLLNVNRQYLGHDYYTDIITFDYVKDKVISGDMFISVDTIKDNAEYFGVTFENELLRVMIHGIMHLVGYDDLTDEQEAEIHRMEDKYLDIYYKNFSK